MAFLADLFSRNSLSSLGVLSKSQILTPFEKNIRTPYFSRLFSVLGINSVIFMGFLSFTWYHLVPLDSITFHLTRKARNAVWGNSPRVRIPNSPPEKIPQLIQSCRLRYCYSAISNPCISIIPKQKRYIRGIFHPPCNAFLCCFLRLFPKPYTTIVIQYITVDLYDFRYYIHPVNRTEG